MTIPCRESSVPDVPPNVRRSAQEKRFRWNFRGESSFSWSHNRSNFALFAVLKNSLDGDAALGTTPRDVDTDDGGLLLRTGLGATALAVAALTIGFNFDRRVGYGTAPANAGLRIAAPGVSVFGTIHPKLFNFGAAAPGFEIPDAAQVQLASLELPDKSDAALGADDGSASRAPASDRASFVERFSFDQAQTQNASLQGSEPSASFEDRFAGTISAAMAPIRSALAEPRAAGPLAAPPQAPAAVVQAARKRTAPKVQMASLSDDPLPAAYAPSDSVPKDQGIRDLLLRDLGPKDSGSKDATPKDPLSDIDTSRTAIYDISAHTVYLPNGQRLEAHSGLGSRMDNPRYVNVKMHGPTPPNVYELKLREAAFHGVRALRLNPVDETKMYGRDGILAHTYMLGPNGQSNGCVSFSDYQAFLNAYLRGEIERLVVVERLAAPPASRTASGWLSNTLKGIFGRS
jgi:hypothetical protein